MSERVASERKLSIVWQDPLIGGRAALAMAGMEYLRAVIAGLLPPPPIAALVGLVLVDAAPGRVVVRFEPGEHHCNPVGAVQGGVVATLFDAALGSAVHAMLPPGASYTTLELKVNYVRPIHRGTGALACTGETLHVGARQATAQGRLTDAEGKLYAHATTTCMIFRPEAGDGVCPIFPGDAPTP